MAKLIIEIPENVYKELNENTWDSMFVNNELTILESAFQQAIPLPKGHGRLIDADKALDYFTVNMNWVDEDDNRIDNSEERKAIFKDYFDSVPTIIEADTAERKD